MEHMNVLWKWVAPEPGRLARAKKIKLISVNKSGGFPSAQCIGSSGEVYHITLQECTCVDFDRGGKLQPCKHMIALALHCGIIDKDGLTAEQQDKKFVHELSIKVALASAFYHLYDLPVISDADYAALKFELWDNSGMIREEEIVSASHIDPAAGSAKKLLAMPLNEYIDRIANIADMNPDTFSQLTF